MDGEMEVFLDGVKREMRRANHLLECILETLLSGHSRTWGEAEHGRLERKLASLDSFDNAPGRDDPW